ncbi:BTAD domain-containing putative transcriptional regulator [Streptomyces sp. B6B3]|uniref:AfsR/SARP family transcriptional regulator n=1 Tax=Streptomyces sp. B6B3 TaxID=3153570 RepID=UPI00325F3099
MDFLVLGPLEIRRDARRDTVPGRLRRSLLGVLLARANQAVPADVLVDALWGERPEERARQRLHLHVHRLRTVIGDGDRLRFDENGYRLRVLPGELDAERFETLVAEGLEVAGGDPRRAAGVLREALGLWRDTPFADLDVPLLADWARALAERRLVACEALFEAEVACGRSAAVAGELATLVREHPLRERLHGLLMIALYRSGRQGAALEAYRSARDTLVAELGLEPGPELRDLEARILVGEPVEVGAEQEEEPRTAVPAQLPGDVTGFVGREVELAELDGLLSPDAAGARGVVISAVAGTAGVGKTALALRWAHQVRERFPDGQLYVDLRGYGPDQPVTPQDALAGFLRALGLEGAAIPQDEAERAARFRTLLDGRRMLVVLDNAHSVTQVRPLLPGSPTCFALVTSRDALAGLVARDGAHRLNLDRLPLPDARALLHATLGDRAATDPAATDALIERCARLPLALRITAELARSQPTRPLADLVEELADQQGALDLLDIDGDPHTAVRAVFSWSYQRLDPPVARAFRLLGVHPGHDVDAHAIAAMVGAGPRETRRALDALLRAHLVDQIGGSRYQPHDLLRAYAAELAADTDGPVEREAALGRLLEYYLATASAAMDVLVPHETYRRPKVPAWNGEAPPLTSHDHARRWLDAERANLLETTRHGDDAYTIAAAQTIWRYLVISGHSHEMLALWNRELRAAETLGDPLAEAHARTHLALSLSATGRGRGDERVTAHLQAAIDAYERAGEPELQAVSTNNLGTVVLRKGELTEATRQFERALELIGPTGRWTVRRAARVNLALCLQGLGRYEEALSTQEAALVLCQEHGDETNEANVLVGLAETHYLLGQQDQARERALRSLALARKTGYRGVEPEALRLLGVLCRDQGDHEQAIRHQTEALEMARSVGIVNSLVECLIELAATHVAVGDSARALAVYDEAVATATEAGHRKWIAQAHAGAAAVHAGLGDHERAREHWHQALDHYEALDLPQADEVRRRLTGDPARAGADTSR